MKVQKTAKKNVQKAKVPRNQTFQKKYLCCDFQTNDLIPSRPISNTCMFCGFRVDVTRPGMKGELCQHNCCGSICVACIQRCLEQQYKQGIKEPFCPVCLKIFSDAERARIHPVLNNQISETITLSKLGNVIQCRFCSNKYIFEPASTIETTTYNGRELTEEQIECQAKNAVTCNECIISSCRQCGAVPFHFGETCEEHQRWVEGKICRICGRAAQKQENLSTPTETSLLTCGHPDCDAKSLQMCNHIHHCGHACVGFRDEEKHPPCPECSINGSLCPACGKDLWGSLCLLLECGHTIHYECALEIIKKPRNGPELDLPLCPQIGCGEFVKHPKLREADSLDYNEWIRLEGLVNRAAHQRIEAEGIEFHPEVASKSSPFLRNNNIAESALNWAKKKLRFMICQNHENSFIYTNGRIEDPPLPPSSSCSLCHNYPYPKCKLHGAGYMQYKCEYCCSIAVRKAIPPNKNKVVLLCEICHDMPGRQKLASQSPCKGNCGFAPHPKSSVELYGRCSKCGSVHSVIKKSPT